MADFDEKLNQILSNPDAMAQIARLAQSLSAPPSAPASDSGLPDVPPNTGNVSPPPPNTPPPPDASNTPPDASDVPPSGASHTSDASPPKPAAPSTSPNDVNSVARFLPLLQELGGDSNARRLLYALRPYLRPQKQAKVERALRLARLFRVGKKFLSQWEE